jgi:rSAM/selenodomain-associated transferase 1
MKDNALIVVAKEPVPGRTKTRLCPPLKPEPAAEFYRCLMLDTFALMERLQTADHSVAYVPERARSYFERLVPDGFRLVAQQGADLGERLANAIGYHFDLGYRRVVIMNSDGPTLPLACLEEAFAELESADITLGPGHDGGYYLIGMSAPGSVGPPTARVVRRGCRGRPGAAAARPGAGPGICAAHQRFPGTLAAGLVAPANPP